MCLLKRNCRFLRQAHLQQTDSPTVPGQTQAWADLQQLFKKRNQLIVATVRLQLLHLFPTSYVEGGGGAC